MPLNKETEPIFLKYFCKNKVNRFKENEMQNIIHGSID